MTNEEKAREIAENNQCDYPFRGGLINTSKAECEDSALEMAEWKDQQYRWNDRMYEIAVKYNLTNKEFRHLLEQLPDDAIISVECCNPRAMIYDKEYNLIRID